MLAVPGTQKNFEYLINPLVTKSVIVLLFAAKRGYKTYQYYNMCTDQHTIDQS